ncbi:MAG: hypothetical protein RJQ09_20730 [Cyclobacteriaceae bacterium]
MLKQAPTLPTSVRINLDDPGALKRNKKESKKEENQEKKEKKKHLKALNKVLDKRLDSLNDVTAKNNRRRNLRESLLRLEEENVIDLQGADALTKHTLDSNLVKNVLSDYASESTDYPVDQAIDNSGVDSSMVKSYAASLAAQHTDYPVDQVIRNGVDSSLVVSTVNAYTGNNYTKLAQFTIYKDSVGVLLTNDSLRNEFVMSLAGDNNYYRDAQLAQNGNLDSLAFARASGGMSPEDYFISKFMTDEQLTAFQAGKMTKEELMPSMEKYFSEYGINPEQLDFENQQAFNDKVAELAKAKYEDHFANNNDALVKAKTSLEVIKKKRSFKDFLDYFVDQETELLKEKKMKERISIGGYLSLQRGKPNLLDLSPTIAYRATGKVTVGLGGIYRKSFGKKKQFANSLSENVVGYKGFVDYLFIMGLYFHMEFESLRTNVRTTDDNMRKEWVDGYLFGLGRDFRVYNFLAGSAQILYNFNYQSGKTPYASPWQFRFGFKYQ